MADRQGKQTNWLAKTLTVVFPVVVLEDIFPRHTHSTFAVGALVGVLLQHFIPPRGSTLQLCLLVSVALVLALLNWWLF
jgi:hypothetical protein